jgi:hypothetical protein
VVAVVAGLAVAVTAGVALAGGFTESGGTQSEARPPSSAPARQGVPSPPGGDATGAPEPEAGSVYQGVRLPAGYGVSFGADPPIVQAGTSNGDFGFTPGADAFTVRPKHGTLALLTGQDPVTVGVCRTTKAAQVTSVARSLLSPGDRLCVRSTDGTTAVVTVRQLTAPGAPTPSAVLDLMVWRTAAPSTTAPSTTVPSTTAPSTTEPGLTAPATTAPGVTALSVSAARRGTIRAEFRRRSGANRVESR